MSSPNSPNLCCCCSLKTGGNAIGVMKIISGALLIMCATMILGTGGPFSPTTNFGDNLLLNLYPQQANSDVDAESMRINVSVILLIAAALTIIPNILLLCGIAKNSPNLLKIWIITQIVILNLAILGILTMMAMHHIYPSLTSILSLALELWFTAVIIYLRREFLGERPNITATAVSNA